MEIDNDININYPVSGSVKPNTDYYPTAMEVRVMTNLVCDSKRDKLTIEIRKQIYDLILKEYERQILVIEKKRRNILKFIKFFKNFKRRLFFR